jgi:hypothetical protein
MIGRTLRLLSLVVGLAVAAAAPGLAQQTSSPPTSSQDQSQPPAQACPPGTHWEPAGYIRDGKYRDARCARNDGRE